MMLGVRPHLSVKQWLEKLDLPLYIPNFMSYNGVEDMLHLSERELKNLGIRNGSHRARMATSLAVLREKYRRAYKSQSPNTSTMSLKVDNMTSKSRGSISPVHRVHLETSSSGVRSWPSSGSSSLTHTRHSSHRSSLEGTIRADATEEELRKALEWELSLDKGDLRSHAWYHGTILRQRAEAVIVNNGDFLVRDCISQPGDFVITCKWKSLPLHFIIKKVILQPNTIYEKIQFSFEDDSFDSIHDFITYYVGSQCPLSLTSGVILCRPINRSLPLSYYTSHYGVQCQVEYAAKKLEEIPSVTSPLPEGASLHKVHKNGMKNAIPEPDENKEIIPSTGDADKDRVPNRKCKLVRVGSDPSLNPNAEKKTFENRPNSGTFTTEISKEMDFQSENEKPPPKPSRVPSKKWVSKPLVVRKERKNTPPTPFLEVTNVETFAENDFMPKERSEKQDVPVRAGRVIPYKRMVSGETRFSFLDHPSVSSEGSLSDTETLHVPFTLPKLNRDSCFSPSLFRSPLLMSDNKPLEAIVLQEIQNLLLNESSKSLASHLTRLDLEISKNYEDEDLGLGVTCGFEMMLLPQGEQLVADLLERTHCLKIIVATTILTCTSEEERVQVLGKWIDIAIETKNSFGNIYGFTGVMLGLTIPQVANLNFTWLALRQLHTSKTYTFETKLRPAFKAMQGATSQIAPNTCIPYILSLLSILHHHTSVMKTIDKQIDEKDFNFSLPSDNNDDFGLEVLEGHLKASRSLLLQWPEFQTNADMAVKKVKYDDTILDLFRTEFHMRLLWGSKGAVVDSDERHKKFNHVLDVLFKMYQHRFQDM